MIAIAVGDLAFRDLGPRTGVWTEPSMLDAAAKELEDTEKMVDAAEALYGPYRWGRYDLLVLPPAFPFGGMENPTLTFLTPTFIAGDKSLVGLIAHELAHSWSGNLATNATWSDFWLNEGMTTYATYRIMESLYGAKVAQQQYALGIDGLNKTIAEKGAAGAADTRLHLDLKGRHPDDGLTDIAYEKGAAFLRHIETTVGRQRFDAFMKGWFDRHAFQPVTTAMFLAELRSELIKSDKALETQARARPMGRPARPSGVAGQARSRRPSRRSTRRLPPSPRAARPTARLGEMDHRRAAALPHQAAAQARQGPARRARSRLRPQQHPAISRSASPGSIWPSPIATIRRFRALDEFLSIQGRRKFVRPLIEALAKDQAWGRPIAAGSTPGPAPPITRSPPATSINWGWCRPDSARKSAPMPQCP